MEWDSQYWGSETEEIGLEIIFRTLNGPVMSCRMHYFYCAVIINDCNIEAFQCYAQSIATCKRFFFFSCGPSISLSSTFALSFVSVFHFVDSVFVFLHQSYNVALFSDRESGSMGIIHDYFVRWLHKQVEIKCSLRVVYYIYILWKLNESLLLRKVHI